MNGGGGCVKDESHVLQRWSTS